MLISEIFYSLQGEGTHTGTPSVFIRTSGCNLRCAWCDTPYASWDPEGIARTTGSILAECGPWEVVEHVVITGGEPLLQRDLPELVEALKDRGHLVTIETAGTLHVHDVRPQFFSLSPKLGNSAPGRRHPEERAIHQRHNTLEHLPRYLESGIDYQFKFVVRDDGDTDEILALVDELTIPRNRVLLMPEGVTRRALRARGPVVAAICAREGFRYTQRLHIDLWGNTRGR